MKPETISICHFLLIKVKMLKKIENGGRLIKHSLKKTSIYIFFFIGADWIFWGLFFLLLGQIRKEGGGAEISKRLKNIEWMIIISNLLIYFQVQFLKFKIWLFFPVWWEIVYLLWVKFVWVRHGFFYVWVSYLK